MKFWRMVAAVALALVGMGVSPAWACACGGYLPDAGSRARAAGENALVRFDGSREEIVLSMAIEGQSKKAAWIMPVPAAAQVELGETGLFGRLESAIRPRVEVRTTYWPFDNVGFLGGRGDGAGAGPRASVNVRAQMVLGPFQVARLGSTSATAVTDWLRVNGYAVPEGLADNLTPYITEKWEIVAVKLAPKSADEQMSGATPPLRLSFPATKIVYPMRLSKGAKTAQTVTVYVAAPYRVDATQVPDPAVKPELLYAGRLEGESYRELTAPASYLTAFTATYSTPSSISADFAFEKAANDEEFQRVVYIDENDGTWTTLAILAGGALLIGLGAALIARRSARRTG